MFILIIMLFSPKMVFSAPTNLLGFNARLGMVNGTFSGGVEGDINVISSFDGEAEYFNSPTSSLIARMTLTIDPDNGKLIYFYGGTGQRFYFRSLARPIIGQNAFDRISVTPKRRYFWGWDAGFSKLDILSLTDTLSADVTLIEAGGSLGFTQPVLNNLNFQSHLGVSQGHSLSAISLRTVMLKIMFGVSF